MAEHEHIEASTDEQFAVDKDEQLSNVEIPQSNRVVVYGSRLSGAISFGEALEQYLKRRAVVGIRVEMLRDAGYIRPVFYGRPIFDTQKIQETPDSLPRCVVIFPEMRQYDDLSGKGMFLETYRNYDYLAADGELYKYPSPFDVIKELCEKHDVPYVRIEHSLEHLKPRQQRQQIKEIRQKVVRLLQPSTETEP